MSAAVNARPGATDTDHRVGECLNRPLTGDWPYAWLNATYLKVRQGGCIVPVAAIVAVAVNTEDRRKIIGLGIGPSEAETFWAEFLRSLHASDVAWVKLVISDAHTGLKAAIARVFEAAWQRCRVHWMLMPICLSLPPPEFALGVSPSQAAN